MAMGRCTPQRVSRCTELLILRPSGSAASWAQSLWPHAHQALSAVIRSTQTSRRHDASCILSDCLLMATQASLSC